MYILKLDMKNLPQNVRPVVEPDLWAQMTMFEADNYRFLLVLHK